MFVIDTNLVSEIFRPRPDEGVVAWLEATPRSALLLPSVVVGELYLGLALLPDGKRRDALTAMTDEFIDAGGEEAVLPYGRAEALIYAGIAAHRQRIGRPVRESDAQIAAIAVANDLPVVTRNVRDFEECGVEILNPWSGTQ